MANQPDPLPERPAPASGRSVVISAVAVAGIVAFLGGAVLTAIGFFAPGPTGASFTGKAAGMSLTTSNVGLALCFFGCVFVTLATALKPVAGVLFFEQDRRSWIERAPPWIAPLAGALAIACLVALVLAHAFG